MIILEIAHPQQIDFSLIHKKVDIQVNRFKFIKRFNAGTVI